MTNFQIIEQKLHKFIRKYYVNELIRGVILFLAIGLLYFLTVAVIEYFFWLNSLGRTILFWSFIGVELGLLVKFVFNPIARLVKLAAGIDFRDASLMIGNHFPEVADKLVNVLQLHATKGDDELTWASINQKSADLKPIPFSLAIDFSKNRHYLKYLAVPVLIIAALIVTGNNEVINSAARVADYKTEYVPPAPFYFEIQNKNLSTLENQNFTLEVKVAGTKLPENAIIVVDGQTYFLNQITPTTYTFSFERPTTDTSFYFIANEVRSIDYMLKVAAVPTIQNFELQLDYPSYTGKQDEILRSTGNALVPQGTNITWLLNTISTDLVQFRTVTSNSNFQKGDDGVFAFAKAITQRTPYTIATSNNSIRDHEKLDFEIEVVPDEYPELSLEMKRDSLDGQELYFKGQAADDYGIRNIQLVYFIDNEPNSIKKLPISHTGGTFQQFLSVFPGQVLLEPGTAYQLYFEVIDNDAVNNFKITKSEVYSFNKKTATEEEQQRLQDQKESLSNLEKALKEQTEEQKNIKELSQEQIEKDNRSFNDKRKLEQAVKNQQQREQEVRKQLNRLENQLDKSIENDDPKKEQLKQRLQESIDASKQNEELLKKIEEYQDKISKEELQEELSKTQKNARQQQRSLKQLLELTKRYYVTQKFEQLGDKLKELADKQEEQSKKIGDLNYKQDQEQLNKLYLDWEKELRELEKENNQLKYPMNLDFDPGEADDIKKDQNAATQSLENGETNKAQPKQKSAARKMGEQASKMASHMTAMESEAQEEDLEMLRQVLDNLVVFSETQEQVLDGVKALQLNSPSLGKILRKQKELELAFKHVDDSLFALSLRNPELGKQVNEEVVNIYYYMDRSMSQLAEFDLQTGQVSQQFTLGSANKLALFLSEMLDAANNPGMPGKAGKSGNAPGFQLPDLIKQQESLQESGKKGKEGKKGEKGKQGQQGDQGLDGQQGQSGENGKSGEGTNSSQSGNGQDGQSGEGQTSGERTGSSSGNNGNGSSGGGESDRDGESSYRESEEESKRIYDIYKQQQELRNQLEDMMIKEGLQQRVDEITGQMKAVERKLLDQGFDRDVQNQMTRIIHDLLKLKDANLIQGDEEQRQSDTNKQQFNNPIQADPELLQRYFNNKEILNRQVLPLQPEYRSRLKEYFKQND